MRKVVPHFRNLRELRIMAQACSWAHLNYIITPRNQAVTEISGLEGAGQLEALWVCETGITAISGLGKHDDVHAQTV